MAECHGPCPVSSPRNTSTGLDSTPISTASAYTCGRNVTISFEKYIAKFERRGCSHIDKVTSWLSWVPGLDLPEKRRCEWEPGERTLHKARTLGKKAPSMHGRRGSFLPTQVPKRTCPRVLLADYSVWSDGGHGRPPQGGAQPVREAAYFCPWLCSLVG